MALIRSYLLKNKLTAGFQSKVTASTLALLALIWSGLAQAEYKLNFQEPVTEIAREIFDLHMLITYICAIIFVLVFGVMFYSIFKHRKSKGAKASQFSHSTTVEIIWTIIPVLILISMAIPATKTLIKMEDTTKSDLTIKITAYQWKWQYDYVDSGIGFYSTLATPRAQIDGTEEKGENYLLEVDNHLIVPSGRKVRALITANDVIHAWWIPAFGAKKDAVPGYINEFWFNVEEGKEGIYRGQCAELCGKDHAFMPIVVEVVTADKFDNWVASGGAGFDTSAVAKSAKKVVDVVAPVAEAAEPAPAPVATKTWTQTDLMARGEEVYNSGCAACHSADGAGMPGVFPAISGSPVATGDAAAHIDLVMNGSPGTAMAAYAAQLSDEDLASVITFQRNALGNNTGDVVSPSDIKAKR